MSDRTEFTSKQLDRLLAFFQRFDSKASFLFALDLAMLGLLAINYPTSAILSWAGGWGLVAGGLLVASLIVLYFANYPRLMAGAQTSMIYFGDIAGQDLATYRDKVSTASDSDVEADLLCQVHRNAEILKAKYEALHTAHTLTLAGALTWLIFLGVVASQGLLKWKA